MEEENYDKIISECTKEIDSAGRYTTEALLLRATFYLLIGNANAAQPDLDRVINMQDANVKVTAGEQRVLKCMGSQLPCFSSGSSTLYTVCLGCLGLNVMSHGDRG